LLAKQKNTLTEDKKIMQVRTTLLEGKKKSLGVTPKRPKKNKSC
jgi:hypothetical protein